MINIKPIDKSVSDDEQDDEKKEEILLRPHQYTPLPYTTPQAQQNGALSEFFTAPSTSVFDPPSKPNPKQAGCSARFALLKVTQPNVTDLVRTSCDKLMKHSKYVEVNYPMLSDYLKRIRYHEIEDNCSDDDDANNLNMFEVAMEGIEISERDTINMTCLFVILQYGSGFKSMIHKQCTGHGVETLARGIINMYKKYSALDVCVLSGITLDDVSKLFEIDLKESLQRKSLCDMIRMSIQETVHILQLKHLKDFADYVYHYIDIAWIKSQTLDLSAIKTVEWKLNKRHEIGLTLAPTQSSCVRRSVVIGYEESNDDVENLQNNQVCKDLVDCGAFLYAINDQVVYNKPFTEVVDIISSYLTATEANEWNPLEYKVGGTRVVALQFGLHLDREPKNMQTLLFNFINDFARLNNQYLYKSLFAPKKNLRVYLFQGVQSLIMELYYNLYFKRRRKYRNSIFNFEGISTFTAVVDNAIPLVFLQDQVIQIKPEYEEEFNQYIGHDYNLHTSDLEVELLAASVCAIEAMIATSKSTLNVAKLTYYLRDLGKSPKYSLYAKSNIIN